MSKLKIGVIGSGDVGKQLAGAFAKLGHPVTMGTREPGREDVVAWTKETGAKAGTNAEAATFGEVVVLATDWSGTENAVRLAGPERLRGKLLIDVTNPLTYREGGLPPLLAVSGNDSAGERVQRWAPGAKVVKTLNVVSHAQMDDPGAFGDPTMFVAGDDEAAKRRAEELLRELGWRDIIDLGGIEAARLLEAIALVWIVHGFRTGKWTHALKMIPAK
ncbi:MAG: 8-hydroxy-5-deazaflavin:NADPH oxidoreductase [Thermoplasmata archaeon]|jgi:predicted dinucleotide-binding enzyme|nr:8-hydroxy-5-deazaflavin:NADPH oxidoreductase [Thermoplasmata archaeon]